MPRRPRYDMESSFFHLYRCIEYIHNNPVKANICKKQGDYQYSSYQKIYDGNIYNIANKLKQVLECDINEIELESNVKSLFEKYEMVFIEYNQTKEELMEEFLQDFEDEYNIKLEELAKDKEMLLKIIRFLKNNLKLSCEKIGNKIAISRETVRKMLKE